MPSLGPFLFLHVGKTHVFHTRATQFPVWEVADTQDVIPAAGTHPAPHASQASSTPRGYPPRPTLQLSLAYTYLLSVEFWEFQPGPLDPKVPTRAPLVSWSPAWGREHRSRLRIRFLKGAADTSVRGISPPSLNIRQFPVNTETPVVRKGLGRRTVKLKIYQESISIPH